ncbi:hypothetical protein BYT27DRAFT_7182017 [Phlegmacium glaucopus]|nr:hypothetical protein BYT27DRAFT_7182017 [Phlegmacium glaucopus]
MSKVLADFPIPVLKLKAAFDTGVSRPLGWRRKQIEGIHDLVQKNTESLVSAALKDDRLTRTEILLELTSVLQLAKQKVEELVEYERSRVAFTTASRGVFGTLRGRVTARSNPSGIVVIKSDWAYPYSSLLNSMVASFANGNLCLVVPSSAAISTILSSLFPLFLDHSGFATLDLADITKSTARLLSTSSSPSLVNLSISPSGDIFVTESASAPSATSVAYIHETGDAPAAGHALVHAKIAFNAQSPFAPTIAFVDDAVYQAVVASVKGALRDLAARRGVHGADVVVESFVKDGNVKVLNNDPLWVLEAGSKTTFTFPDGRQPFLILSRVSSPDAAVDRIKLLPAVSAFYIYATEPFRSYVIDDVDSIVTVVNDIPVDYLVNPLETPFSNAITKVLTRPQQVIIASKRSSRLLSLSDSALSLQLEKKILKSHIRRLFEGDGTRWDFFERVKMVYTGVKYLTYVSVFTGAFFIYRRYTK